jgi:DNA polymerase-4
VRALWGVGPATYQRLERFGVATVGDLAAIPVDTLVTALGPALGTHLHNLAWARDPRPVEPHRQVKSISHEQTYPHDLHERDQLVADALRMADAVAGRLRRASLAARTITVKVRFHDFATVTRSQTLPEPVDTTPPIARAAAALLSQVDATPGVRLLGVGATNLCEGAVRQLTLLDGTGRHDSPDATAGDWEQASQAVDRIRDRFGTTAVGPAALLGRTPPRSAGGTKDGQND